MRIRPLVLGTRWNGCLLGVLAGNLAVFGLLISPAAGVTGIVFSLLPDRCHSRLGIQSFLVTLGKLSRAEPSKVLCAAHPRGDRWREPNRRWSLDSSVSTFVRAIRSAMLWLCEMFCRSAVSLSLGVCLAWPTLVFRRVCVICCLVLTDPS